MLLLKRITIPHKKILVQPWMTKGIQTSSNKAQKMFIKCAKSRRSDESHKRYVTYRNILNKLKYKAKKEYYRSILNEYKHDMKKTWKTINNIIGRSNVKHKGTQDFKMGNTCTSDTSLISNGFCEYFTNIGPNLAGNIPNPKNNALHYLQKINRNPNSFFMTPTNPEEILEIIKEIKSKNSSGHDTINTKLIKSIDNSISKPISILINMSIQSGIVPDSLKLAKIIPIYKSKSPGEFSNYRPISLLTSLSKILEKIVHKRLYSFLENECILNPNQFGFRKKHSTIDAVTKFISDITTSLDNKESTIAIYLDLSKAFDTINHTLLLKKLDHYGIRGLPLAWFKSYLENRKHYIEYKKHTSRTCKIECGVPQGSIVGPLLFLLYINDLPNIIKNAKTILYADDTTIYVSGKNLGNLREIINSEISILSDWFRANKLSLNEGKTNYMHVHDIYKFEPSR